MQHPDDGPEVVHDDRIPGGGTSGDGASGTPPDGPHVDEGTIHAWLDGQLTAVEADALAAHLDGCARCREAVAEARGLVAASARVLRALDDGPGGVRARPPAAGAASAASRLSPDGAVGEPGAPMAAVPIAAVAAPSPVAGSIDPRSAGAGAGRGALPIAGRGAATARRWRVPAIAAVGILAVGTTLVMKHGGPLAPLTEEHSTASTLAAPQGTATAADSLPAGGSAAAAPGDARGVAPAVAVPPRRPKTSDVAVLATPPVGPDSAPLRPQSAFAPPAGLSSRRSAEAAVVAGAPPPVAVESVAPGAVAARASRLAARTVGPVLTGRVLTDGGEPVAYAQVTVSGVAPGAVTDAQGRFRVAGVPAGEHIATVSRVGFEPLRLPLHVAATGDSIVTVALAPLHISLSATVVTGMASAAGSTRSPAADAAKRAAPAGAGVPARPYVATQQAPAPAPAPVAPPPPAPEAPGGVASAAAQRLAGCYRFEVGGAVSAARDSAEAALPGWLHLSASPAAGRPGWLTAEPLLPTRRTMAGGTGWRIDEDDEVEIVWPAAVPGREVVLRLRGSGEVLTGTAALRPVAGVPETEREAASVVAVRSVCNQS